MKDADEVARNAIARVAQTEDEDLRAAQLLAVGCVLARDDKGEQRGHPRWTPTLGLARTVVRARFEAEEEARRWKHSFEIECEAHVATLKHAGELEARVRELEQEARQGEGIS